MELVRENENVGADEDSDNYDAYWRGENQIPARLKPYFIKKPRPEGQAVFLASFLLLRIGAGRRESLCGRLSTNGL